MRKCKLIIEKIIASFILCGCLLLESTALVSASECGLYGVQILHLVSQPIIGAGLSKTKYGERAILEYLVKSLKLNKDLIVSDIYIVVRNSGKETIPITEL